MTKAKVNRLPLLKNYSSIWCAANKKEHREYIIKDILIRKVINEYMSDCMISEIKIIRGAKYCTAEVYCARINHATSLRTKIADKIKKALYLEKVLIAVKRIENPETDAEIIASVIANKIEDNPFRRICIRFMQIAKKFNYGIHMQLKGRIKKNPIARKEQYGTGRLPRNTLKADLQYAFKPAHTKSGVCGVKVWVYKGNISKTK